MPTVTFLPGYRKVTVPEGASLLDAARAAGLAMNVVCGGQGRVSYSPLRAHGTKANIGFRVMVVKKKCIIMSEADAIFLMRRLI